MHRSCSWNESPLLFLFRHLRHISMRLRRRWIIKIHLRYRYNFIFTTLNSRFLNILKRPNKWIINKRFLILIIIVWSNKLFLLFTQLTRIKFTLRFHWMFIWFHKWYVNLLIFNWDGLIGMRSWINVNRLFLTCYHQIIVIMVAMSWRMSWWFRPLNFMFWLPFRFEWWLLAIRLGYFYSSKRSVLLN